jgi:hypothetical protein
MWPVLGIIAALPSLPATGYNIGDYIITGDGNLVQIIGP